MQAKLFSIQEIESILMKLTSYANLRLNFGLCHKTTQSYMTITYRTLYPLEMNRSLTNIHKREEKKNILGSFTCMSISKVLKMNYKFKYDEIETFTFSTLFA